MSQINPFKDRNNHYLNFLKKYLNRRVWICNLKVPEYMKEKFEYLKPTECIVIKNPEFDPEKKYISNMPFKFENIKTKEVYSYVINGHVQFELFDFYSEASDFVNRELRAAIADCKSEIEEIQEKMEAYRRLKI